MSEPKIEAWETEDGDIIVVGTHDAAEGEAAWRRYLETVDVSIDDYDPPPDFQTRVLFWVDPEAMGIEDEVWPRAMIRYQPKEGWLPAMRVDFL